MLRMFKDDKNFLVYSDPIKALEQSLQIIKLREGKVLDQNNTLLSQVIQFQSNMPIHHVDSYYRTYIKPATRATYDK